MKAVYIRTSTEEQEPENQIREIETISGKDYTLFQDKQSAWKDDKERQDFEKLRTKIKEHQVKDLFVWDWDRLFRNRKKLKEFFQFCTIYKCHIHSFRQGFFETFYKIPSPFDEIMQELFLNLLGWMAEDESTKKSSRVKAAVRKKEGEITMSYKGNKWGRKSLSTQKKNKIRELLEIEPKLSLRDISLQSGASLGSVHKTIQEIKSEKTEELNVQNLPN
jgi:DNA invertase Pin-like site-specific DNA recombinase